VAFVVLLAFLISQILVLLFGFGVAWVARRRPLATSAIIVAVVMAGFGAIWCGGEMASAGLSAGPYLLAAGLILVFVGFPTWGIVVPAVRGPNGPVGLTGWARLLATYLAGCWIFTLFLGLPLVIFVQLATAPPGSLR
jgi:hypothetical protein